jgi:hypothetical protein
LTALTTHDGAPSEYAEDDSTPSAPLAVAFKAATVPGNAPAAATCMVDAAQSIKPLVAHLTASTSMQMPEPEGLQECYALHLLGDVPRPNESQ